jgi:hypothetical protein
MKIFRFVRVALIGVVALLLGSPAGFTADQDIVDGIWSTAGKTLFVSNNDPPRDIQSPDKKTVVRYDKDGLYVAGKTVTRLQEINAPLPLIEVLWIPDSRGFVVNWSNGGLVGDWNTNYYALDADGRPVLHDIGAIIAPYVRGFAQCEVDKGEPHTNLGTIAWAKNNRELFVVAEVPPHSICKNMGEIRGFRVSTDTWTVVEQLSDADVRSKWTVTLGQRLSKARN